MEQTVAVEDLKQETRQKNLEVKKLADENQKNISRLREHLKEADAQKKTRDEYNAKVKEISEKRRVLIEESRRIDAELREAETQARKYQTDTDIPYAKLARLIEQMEWQLQTQSMPPKAENALSQDIRKLLKKKEALEKGQPLRKKIRDLRKRKGELGIEFRALEETQEINSKESDKHHEAMLKSYKKADDARAKISEYLEKIGEKRKDADETYMKMREAVGEVRAESEKHRTHERKERKKKEQDRMGELEEKAQQIYIDFKAGKKVSIEELQILQMAGIEI